MDFGSRPEQLRGAAALVVFFGHAWQVYLYPLDKDALAFTVLGGAAMWAVAVFFLLSGILIASSIKRRVAVGGFDLPAYLKARVRRIFPPLLAATAITVLSVLLIKWLGLYGAQSYWLPGDEAVARESATLNMWSIVSTITLTYGLIPGTSFLTFDGPLWSLVYEFWFYVAAGLIAAAASNRSVLSAILAAGLIVVMLFIADAVPSFLALGLVWAAGFLVGWFWPTVAKLPVAALLGMLIISAVSAIAIAGSDLPEFLVSSYVSFRQNTFYFLVSCGLLVLIVLYLRRGRSPRFAGGFLAWVGGFSYTLYLVHFPLFMLLLSVMRPSIVPFGTVGHVLLASVSMVVVFLLSERLSVLTENSYRRHVERPVAAQ